MRIEEIATLASDQNGLFTTAQAARLEVDRVTLHRAARNGVVRSIRHGVYIFESAPFSPDEELRAAWLSLDPSRTVAERLQTPEQIVICTTSAAQQYGIGDFETPQHEFYSAHRKQTRAEDIRLRIRTLDNEDIEIRDGLPLTTPTRIILDLLDERHDLVHISRLIADAARKGLKVEWSRLATHAHKFAEDYQLTDDGLLQALAESSESTSDTAMAALSMLESSSHLNDLFTKELANLVGGFSKHLTIQTPEIPDLAAQLSKVQIPDIADRIPNLSFLPNVHSQIHDYLHHDNAFNFTKDSHTSTNKNRKEKHVQ